MENYQWYYGATFINEVLKHCNSEPLVVEYSHIYPSVWPGRGRGECWDRPKRGYKNFIEDHTVRNQGLRNRNYVTTLGWYDFYPTSKNNLQTSPQNICSLMMWTILEVKAIAYDQTMVYEGLLERKLMFFPALSRNLNAFALYNNLRMNCYFTDKVKDKLKEGKYEFKLERDKGRWGFKEVVYNQSKLRDIKKTNWP